MPSPGGRRGLKVAQIVETMTMGGAENLAVRIANSLASQGHESHLIVMSNPDVLSQRIDPQVKTHYLNFERGSIRNPARFLFSLQQGTSKLERLIKTQGIEVVQTHLPGSNFWGLLLALKGVCHVISTIHNNQEFRYGDSDNKFLTALRKRAYSMIVARCDATVAVSEKVRESLILELGLSSLNAEKIVAVNNGVHIPDLLTEEKKVEVRIHLGIAPGLPLILAAGRMSEQKNFGDLIEAASILREKGMEFRLVIAGDGEQRSDLVAAIESHGLEGTVLVPGNLNNLADVMLSSDVYAMTSRWEGLPLVLLEAMAAGLPGVAFDIPGVRELITPDETGVLVPLGQAEAFAEGLGSVLSDASLKVQMGKNARRKVSEKFNFSDQLALLVDLYTQYCGENREKNNISRA
jgi:glycosyltransferase involved in cell wall biosynthesis